MNFDVLLLESQINTDYEINVNNEVNIVEKLAMKKQSLWRKLQQSFIAEILLNKMNLYCRPWHVVVVACCCCVAADQIHKRIKQ